jgi:hypothetical protein
VHPLGDALDKVARMSPLFELDEFAWDRIDDPTREWYEAQHRALVASGREPVGPPDLGEWRAKWDDLHPSTVVLEEVRRRFETRHYEDLPYLFRWLDGPASAPLEEALLAAGAVRPIGFRWAGVSRSAAARPAG